ncbi:MAG TPA: hypothetical protein VL358_16260 [Caulobacteraceae bacterium]|jgi:hypothetical protein|nr:hypothetical protein [Caulobacteraceae bacterium]
MADLRIPSAAPPAALRPQAPARVDAAKAAQRAFFQAALGDQTPAGKPAAPPATRTEDASPQRLPRPGSLIDIKV